MNTLLLNETGIESVRNYSEPDLEIYTTRDEHAKIKNIRKIMRAGFGDNTKYLVLEDQNLILKHGEIPVLKNELLHASKEISIKILDINNYLITLKIGSYSIIIITACNLYENERVFTAFALLEQYLAENVLEDLVIYDNGLHAMAKKARWKIRDMQIRNIRTPPLGRLSQFAMKTCYNFETRYNRHLHNERFRYLHTRQLEYFSYISSKYNIDKLKDYQRWKDDCDIFYSRENLKPGTFLMGLTLNPLFSKKALQSVWNIYGHLVYVPVEYPETGLLTDIYAKINSAKKISLLAGNIPPKEFMRGKDWFVALESNVLVKNTDMIDAFYKTFSDVVKKHERQLFFRIYPTVYDLTPGLLYRHLNGGKNLAFNCSTITASAMNYAGLKIDIARGCPVPPLCLVHDFFNDNGGVEHPGLGFNDEIRELCRYEFANRNPGLIF